MSSLSKERVIYLLERYTERLATPDELRELTAWMAARTDDTPFQEYVQRLTQQPEASLDNVNWELVYAGITEGMIDQKDVTASAATPAVHRVHFLRKWWWAAASIFLVLGVSAYLWFNRSTNTNNPIAVVETSDVPPGTDGAILTLADGSQVSLDSVQNGTVALQGDITAKVVDGILRYDRNSGHNEVMYNTMTTPNSRQYHMVLPDGTKVWLNAASSIRYPTAFVSKERKVEISGEVYFEVARNTRQPFRVNAGQSEVEVLGTHFNINAYKDKGITYTTLIEGSVRVSLLPLNPSYIRKDVILSPGQQAQADQHLRTSSQVNTDQVLAWKNGAFDFNGVDFSSFMHDVERWYDVTVQYNGPVPTITMRGGMDRNVKLSEIIRFLDGLGVQTTLKGRTLIIENAL